jgi:hypothetical protein
LVGNRTASKFGEHAVGVVDGGAGAEFQPGHICHRAEKASAIEPATDDGGVEVVEVA